MGPATDYRENESVQMINRVTTTKKSVSIDNDMLAWLKQLAAKKRSNVSQVIRELLVPTFERRHAK